MSELLPTLMADDLRSGLVDYLTTTFALADPEAAQALSTFLEDPDDGIFKGPFVRLRLPYRPAADGWQDALGWDPGLTPYGHQAEAYRRLTTIDLGPDKTRPRPTLVTTGTGSGKTEAFLHPILDHCVRANRAGVTGTKALILYPMNALATDQAGRLTELLTTRPELGSVTAGIYTGEQHGTRTTVSKAGLINDRGVMRNSPPDIILTNYKMLDQLLLRPEDQPIWAKSATSLTYLVLDEFHTYDGAQGTDVAMLLRRLGLALKAHWGPGEGEIPVEDRLRPLGPVTPVATSATLGDRGDPATMLAFAETVFGEPFAPDSVVTEARLSLDEWTLADPRAAADPSERRALRDLLDTEVTQLAQACREALSDIDALARMVIPNLCRGDGDLGDLSDADELLAQLKALPDVHTLAKNTAYALSLADVTRLLFPAAIAPEEDPDRRLIVNVLIAVLSHARALAGRSAMSVELNLWIRELTRIDRDAAGQTTFSWFDDGARVGGAFEGDDAPAFPAIYCRHCGRSGWGVELAATGDDLHADDTNIRRRHARKEGRFRPLLTALAEADLAFGHGPTREPVDVPGLVWLSTKSRSLRAKLLDPDDVDVLAGRVLPVLTHRGLDADDLSNAETCPSCLQKDGIRFLGSAIATMLSVTLSGMFGSEDLDAAEKKALVFTDSVQDAAHRAGFVEARSHTLTFRAMVRDAVGDERCNLDELVERIFQQAGADAFHRYRMVPPDLIGREEFDAWWDTTKPVGMRGKARARVKRRLLFDASLEFGLQSSFGRTLERTGSLAAEVDAGPATKLASIGRRVIDASVDDRLDVPVAATPEADLVAWVRGVLEHMRRQGGIHHEWLKRYLESDGRRFFIWGGRRREQGMPAFPGGRSAPAFPKVGGGSAGKDPLLVTVTSAQSWYAVWTANVLGVSPPHGAKLARDLFDQLVKADVLTKSNTDTGGTVYEIPATSVSVVPLTTEDLTTGSTLLVCGICRTQTNGTPEVVGQLAGTPCTVVRCKGRVQAMAREDNFYRRLYASADMRRIVSREHSSLLEDDLRLEYEEQFKSGSDDPNAPNVLVATPTLEMGIDIGDLSSVVLASLPSTVASYLQRVGRAGRLTGNALNLAFVSGRGEYLPRLGDPLSVINGEVRPPATYLNAEEILRRQYFASIVDLLARTPGQRMPAKASGALESAGENSFLHAVITEAEHMADHRLAAFLFTLPDLTQEATDALVAWATPSKHLDGAVDPGTSGLAATAYEASQRWNALNSELAFRRQEILATLPGLQAAAESPAATDDDRRDFRSARGALTLVERHHRDHRQKHWIAALEEYALLPNYTLVDDTVTLDVSVTWRDPDTNEFVSEPRSFNRGAALALREFAPGATFYARGLEMDIDGLDLGSKSALIRRWAWCDTCGYGADLEKDGAPVAVSVCPRCGSGQIADAGQRFDVVELTRVMSEVRRDENRIGESRDERRKTQFVMVAAPDFNPDKVTRQWVAGDGQFGVTHYRAMDIRWLNAGRVGAGAVLARNVAGQGIPNTLFRVCASCGKADSDTNANARSEHRPWCPHRLSPDESARSVALSRTLTTQGLSLTLPLSVTMGDSFAVPSLAAALLLGLRERMGGNPDHISVVTVPMPVADGAAGEVREALLLHDTVPGGTGYLTDLVSEGEVWRVLAAAHGIVANCDCQHENRLACHRCLLPFSRGLGAERLSRVAAERHLRSILLGDSGDDVVIDPETPQWVVTEGPVGGGSGESPLELRFRKVFAERMAAINATVKEKPGPSGNTLTITLPNDARVWTLVPQQTAHGSKPDFVLRSSDPTISPVAIFADGWTYHASPQHNRIADDAAKRNVLRAHDFIVVGLTDADLGDDPSKKPDYGWVSPQIVSALMAQPSGQPGSGINQDAVSMLTGGPLDFLVAWIQQPHHAPRTALADAVWLLLAGRPGITHFQVDAADTVAADLARSLLDGDVVPTSAGSHAGFWWRQGHVGVLSVVDTHHNLPLETVVALDDSHEAVSSADHAASWRRWLQLANSLAGCGYPVTLAATSAEDVGAGGVVAQSPSSAAGGTAAAAVDLSPAWVALSLEVLTPEEQDLVTALADEGVGVPDYGAEVGDGIPVDFSWPEVKVAVLDDTDEDTERELAAEGWVVVRANVEAIVEALKARTGAL